MLHCIFTIMLVANKFLQVGTYNDLCLQKEYIVTAEEQILLNVKL